MNNIIGHDNIKRLLANIAESGHINHAYIFEGQDGIGRLSLAKAFAKELIGDMGGFSADSHPDIIVVTNERFNPSKSAKSLSVDTIRAMKADVYIKPYRADKKIYIIPNADTMLDTAQNSLLKILEEPPEYCIIILIAENANSFLQTIRSRSQLLRMSPLGKSEIRDYLMKNYSIPADKAEILAILSGGSIKKAVALSDDESATELRETVISHLIQLTDSGFVRLYDFIKFLKQNKSDISIILDIILGWSTDVLHIKTGVSETCEIVNADKTAELKKFCSLITKQSALKFTEIISKYSFAISKNANYPIAMQCMATEYWEEIHGRSYRSAF